MEQSFRWNSNGDSRNPGTLIAWMLSGDAKQEKKLICSGKNWALLHRSGMCIPDLKSQPSRVSIRTLTRKEAGEGSNREALSPGFPFEP
jgi:hypothetical protein